MSPNKLIDKIAKVVEEVAQPCDGGLCCTNKKGQCLRALDAARGIFEMLEKEGVIQVLRGNWK